MRDNSMNDCLFCKIINGDIPCELLYQDDELLAFMDINPQAPFHCLIIPKLHISSLSETTAEHETILGKLTLAATRICKEQGFDENGYRLVINCGEDGGQTVQHIHMHILAGRSLQWPPG
jgi:histidine triad (HIT) family protein